MTDTRILFDVIITHGRRFERARPTETLLVIALVDDVPRREAFEHLVTHLIVHRTHEHDYGPLGDPDTIGVAATPFRGGVMWATKATPDSWDRIIRLADEAGMTYDGHMYRYGARPFSAALDVESDI